MKKFFSNAIAKFSPCCRDMAKLSSLSLDRKLSLKEQIGIRMHGWICSWCVDYSTQVGKLNQTVSGEGESLAELKDEKMSDECRARIKAMMETSSDAPKN